MRRAASPILRCIAGPALLLALLVSWAAGQSPATESDSIDIRALVSPHKGWRVTRFEVEGLDPSLAAPLTRGLALATRRGVFRRHGAELYARSLQEDIDRARLFLAREGYPRARIIPRLSDVKSRSRELVVVLVVEPGERRTISNTTVHAWPTGIPRPTVPAELAAGQAVRDAPIEAFGHALLRALRSEGFALAEVHPRLAPGAGSSHSLSFDIESGDRYVFGQIHVSGCRDDLVDLVRKSTGIQPGDRFRPDDLERAEESLRLLNLFRQVRLGVEAAGPPMLDVRAELLERPPRSLEFGGGFWTDDYLRVHAIWRHRNLFRAGRGAELRSSYSRFLREAQGTIWWPAFVLPRQRIELGAALQKELEESYELFDAKLVLSSLIRFSSRLSLRSAIEFANVNVDERTDDPDIFVESGGRLTIFSASIMHDSTDDRLDPSRGNVVWTRLRGTPPGFFSKAEFWSAESSLAHVHSLREKWVLAGHAQAGVAFPVRSSDDLLPNERFYAGGAGSMRGFSRRRLGPADADGSPVGGEAKLELSTELRFPVAGPLRGALFVDAGQVWPRARELRLDELEFAVGPGLMIATPLGPVRMDAGFRLTDLDPDAPRWAFQLSIGHPY